MKKTLLLILLSVSICLTSVAQDTFSIVAIDTITGEVGSAGASCVYIAGQGVMILSDVHPGIGAIHSQAYYLSANQNYARELMNLGLSPQQIIDSLVVNDAQNNPHRRQYGIVDFRDGVVRSAAYTGANCDDYKNHITGPNYSIQGNILLGQQILDSMEARFLRAEGELACRLMEALQGAKVVGADTRCMGDGTSSIGSFLRVAKPDDPLNDLYLQFNIVRANDGVDPIDSLQVLFDEWGGCLGIAIEENKLQVKIFPNPAEKIITFQTNSEMIKLTIFNSLGKEVFRNNITGEKVLSVDISHFAPGYYSYQIISKNEICGSGGFIVQ